MTTFLRPVRNKLALSLAGLAIAGTIGVITHQEAEAANAGTTSAESATVSITIPERVKLSGLTGATDFQFGT